MAEVKKQWDKTEVTIEPVKRGKIVDIIYNFVGDKEIFEIQAGSCWCTSKVFINKKLIIKYDTEKIVGGKGEHPFEKSITILYKDNTSEILKFKGTAIIE